MSGVYDAEVEHVSEMLAAAIVEREPELVNDAVGVDGLVRELLRRVGRRTTGGVFGLLSARVTEEAKAAGYRIERHVVVPYTTLYGTLEVDSPYLVGPCGGARPVKDRLGIVGRAKSPAVERALTDFGIEESFALAGRRFEEHYGFRVGRTSILRVVEGEGRRAESFVRDQLALEPERPRQEPPDVIVVQLDGSEARTATLSLRNDGTVTPIRKLPRKRRVEQWRDVRVGLAARHGEFGQLYVAEMRGYPEVVADLRRAAEHLGAREANLVVIPVDGGPGLREAIERGFAGLDVPLQVVLDWPHCRSNLFEAATEMLLDEPIRTQTVDFWTKRIDEGGVDPLIEDLRQYAAHESSPSGAHRVDNLADYLDRFSDAVHYKKFRDEGLPTGSGRVEAAHRIIPQKRLKKPGAWWDAANINPMLALRVVRENDWWEAFCRARRRGPQAEAA